MSARKKDRGRKLQVQMFGGFRILSEGKTLDGEAIHSEMLLKLLTYLLCHRNKAMTVQELAGILWLEDESDNPAGALKNLMYRLRNFMKQTWGEFDYILTGRGFYQWNPEIEVELDAEQFDAYCKGMAAEMVPGRKLELGLEGAKLYQGAFLPELAGEYWVITMSTYYHSLYLSTVKKLAYLLEEEHKFEKIEQICRNALKLESLDEEIHCILLKAMIADNKQKLAGEHYKETVKYLYDTLGVRPSSELQKIYEELQKEQHEHETDIHIIQEELKEESQPKGAFLCEYGVFKKIYILETRSSGRLGISVHLAIISLYPTLDLTKESSGYRALIGKGMTQLERVLLAALRSSDIICRYSSSQFLVMLPACQYEDAVMVMGRIRDRFYQADRKIKVRIQYSLDEIFVP